jgi:penicillin-binding protein 2
MNIFIKLGGGYKDQKGLGISRIGKYMKSFGFASSTGIDLPQEKASIVPGVEWKEKNFKDGVWLLGDTYHASIGQSGFQTSPIGLARSIAIIANGGKVIIPRIASTTNNSVQSYDMNLDQNILKIIREGMALTTSETGTAHYFGDLPFKVSAKTGTAQLGARNERVNSWSTGYFPRENPKFVFVFMMEGGPATNKVSASKIMRKVFQDMIDKKMEYVN